MAIRGCPTFKRFFEQVMGGKADRKKIALIATAHRLIRVMGAMLRSGEAYDGDYDGRKNHLPAASPFTERAGT